MTKDYYFVIGDWADKLLLDQWWSRPWDWAVMHVYQWAMTKSYEKHPENWDYSDDNSQ